MVIDAGLVSEKPVLDAKTARFELPERVRAELDAFEAALRRSVPDVELVLVNCTSERVGPRTVAANAFGSSVRGISDDLFAQRSQSRACRASVDIVQQAMDELEWKDGAIKRLVGIGWIGSVLSGGRTTIEDVIHRAERKGIVFHAMELFGTSERVLRPGCGGAGRSSCFVGPGRLMQDMNHFLQRPTEPVGRTPSHARHGTLLSGGTYHLASLLTPEELERVLEQEREADPMWRQRVRGRESPEEYRSMHAATWGLPLALPAARDALDDLADGVRRPSEVKKAELPAALQNVALEPLLDAIWEFVDARRVLQESARLSKAREGPTGPFGNAGAELARSLLAPRRLPPSRR